MAAHVLPEGFLTRVAAFLGTHVETVTSTEGRPCDDADQRAFVRDMLLDHPDAFSGESDISALMRSHHGNF